MTYGLNRELFAEDGAAVQAALASRASSARAFQARAYQAWHELDEAQRLALVERTLNDNHGDGFPIAL